MAGTHGPEDSFGQAHNGDGAPKRPVGIAAGRDGYLNSILVMQSSVTVIAAV